MFLKFIFFFKRKYTVSFNQTQVNGINKTSTANQTAQNLFNNVMFELFIYCIVNAFIVITVSD